MKTLMIAWVAVLAVQVNAQKMEAIEVPAIIKDSLAKKYSGSDADWDKEESNYEASFDQKGVEISILFDASGNILETETEINKKDLPPSILAILKKEYPGHKIEEAAKIEANGEVTYEAEIEVKEKIFDLIFDAQGTLLKKEEKHEREDKD